MSQVLLAGVDTLAVGFIISEFCLEPEEWQRLADAKSGGQQSMFSSGGVGVELRGHKFAVSPKGSHGYEYVLVNDDITLQLAERATGGSAYPEVRVTWRSQYLWRYGWRAVYARVREWIGTWADVSAEKVSRADLCIDLNLGVPDVNLKSGEVVSYARSKREFYVEHHVRGLMDTGYRFGQGDLLCRVYDKLAEIEVSSKAWFKQMWQKRGWDGESPVTRVEFQARRGHLVSQQIETMEDLERQLADLWCYFAGWVSLRDEGNDSNRRRWPVKPFWKLVEDAVSHFGRLTGIVRIAQRRPKIEALQRQAKGLMSSMVAHYMATFECSAGVPIGFQAALGWVVEKLVPEWINDDEFRDKTTNRASKFAFMT